MHCSQRFDLITAVATNPKRQRSSFSSLKANGRFSLSRAKKFSILLRSLNLSLPCCHLFARIRGDDI